MVYLNYKTRMYCWNYYNQGRQLGHRLHWVNTKQWLWTRVTNWRKWRLVKKYPVFWLWNSGNPSFSSCPETHFYTIRLGLSTLQLKSTVRHWLQFCPSQSAHSSRPKTGNAVGYHRVPIADRRSNFSSLRRLFYPRELRTVAEGLASQYRQ